MTESKSLYVMNGIIPVRSITKIKIEKFATIFNYWTHDEVFYRSNRTYPKPLNPRQRKQIVKKTIFLNTETIVYAPELYWVPMHRTGLSDYPKCRFNLLTTVNVFFFYV